jgi:2-amino-4-hydroxy-6-hydroxymethyldihydropteridine diphosphokinase
MSGTQYKRKGGNKSMLHIAYVGLGTNLGDREQQLQTAVTKIHQLEDVRVAACSSIYETPPFGYVEQPAFLNMAIRLDTTLDPETLLQRLLGIEIEMGRIRSIRWGPRVIDLDLLRVGNIQVSSELLQLPHPYLFERAFVLVPLLECCASEDSLFREQIELHLQQLEDRKEVVRWTTCNWQDAFVPSGN